MPDGRYFVGIDVGTSGVRACALDSGGAVVAHGRAQFAGSGRERRDPQEWRRATEKAFSVMMASRDPADIAAIAVDGTSGTMLAVDATGQPVSRPIMYNDPVNDAKIVETIAAVAPPESAAHGATSALARAISLQSRNRSARLLHQADWIAGLLSGRFDISDENNALKTGYDPVNRMWPGWLTKTGVDVEKLPRVVEPGTPIGHAEGSLAGNLALPPSCLIVAGTTDGCASFLATGADRVGDAVTALGTTLTVKLLSDKPLFAPEFGIYSHRIPGGWLAGGASNTGGNVISAYFDDATVRDLSMSIDPATDTGLNLYPLTKPGERFPHNDSKYPPRMTPRPDDDAVFLKAILEGIAAVETVAYRRLRELGAPAVRSLRTVGGGAANDVWHRIRQRMLAVPFAAARAEEAAAGTARLAMSGARKAGVI